MYVCIYVFMYVLSIVMFHLDRERGSGRVKRNVIVTACMSTFRFGWMTATFSSSKKIMRKHSLQTEELCKSLRQLFAVKRGNPIS